MVDKNHQIKYYEDLLERHGDTFLSLDWNSQDSQKLRFKIFADLVKMFDNNKISVLDVGCGFGDFYAYFERQNYKFSYMGYDVSPKILSIAKKKYPKASFELYNIMEDKNFKKYDFVFCSGALNICFDSREEHLKIIHSMLIRMYELCNIAVGVNFLSSQALYYVKEEDLINKQYFYTKVEDVLPCVRSLTGRYVVRHDYHPGDFTIYLMKRS